ncbi:MAG: hypothetical protein Q8K07_21260, partial [Methylicorpusculum sp.]|nr:hypothetical protein [Methylicorpusculum sp.]
MNQPAYAHTSSVHSMQDCIESCIQCHQACLQTARGVAIFAKACFGHPSPIKQQKNTRPLMPPAAPIRPRRLVSTQQGVE